MKFTSLVFLVLGLSVLISEAGMDFSMIGGGKDVPYFKSEDEAVTWAINTPFSPKLRHTLKFRAEELRKVVASRKYNSPHSADNSSRMMELAGYYSLALRVMNSKRKNGAGFYVGSWRVN